MSIVRVHILYWLPVHILYWFVKNLYWCYRGIDMINFAVRSTSSKKKARALLYASQGGKCHYCGRECALGGFAYNREERNAWFVLDHVVSIAKGGSCLFDNFVGSCWLCNARKGKN